MKIQNIHIKELKLTLYRLFNNPTAIIGFTLLSIFILIALFAPIISPPLYKYNPYLIPHKGYSETPKPPTSTNLFGTTSGQYDIFYGVVWGTRTAFKIGLFVSIFSCSIGIILGILVCFCGNMVNKIIVKIVNMIFIIPSFILAMVITFTLGGGLNSIVVSLILVKWKSYFVVMRAKFITLRQTEFVQVAKLMGATNFYIMLKHILPNVILPVLSLIFVNFGSIVVLASFLSFIGLGSPRGYADWGQMIALTKNYSIGPPNDPLKFWYVYVFPGTFIFLFALTWNIVGKLIQDILEPRGYNSYNYV